jgi:hypothetical protein
MWPVFHSVPHLLCSFLLSRVARALCRMATSTLAVTLLTLLATLAHAGPASNCNANGPDAQNPCCNFGTDASSNRVWLNVFVRSCGFGDAPSTCAIDQSSLGTFIAFANTHNCWGGPVAQSPGGIVQGETNSIDNFMDIFHCLCGPCDITAVPGGAKYQCPADHHMSATTFWVILLGSIFGALLMCGGIGYWCIYRRKKSSAGAFVTY